MKTDPMNILGIKMSDTRRKSSRPKKEPKHEHEFDALWPHNGPCVEPSCNKYLHRSMNDDGTWTEEIRGGNA